MSEGDDDALIEQLRAFGVSAEELEELVRKTEEDANARFARGTEPVAPAPPPPQPGAFDPLVPPSAPRDEPPPPPPSPSVPTEPGDAETNRMRERALAEAKDAAAQIRASAIRLVSEKLQAAEDEVMALRVRAADEVAKLRSDTARSMVVRLREAETEALALKDAAREEQRAFWRTTMQEFSESQQQMAQVRSQLSRLVTEITDAVAHVESSAYSIVALCQRRLDELQREAPSMR
ncbi:MAG: hypothetical protein WCF24_04935 [Acidimicrobiales bacterium]